MRKMTKAELKSALLELRWPQEYLAAQIGAHPNTVSRWANGRVVVTGAAAAFIRLSLKLRRAANRRNDARRARR